MKSPDDPCHAVAFLPVPLAGAFDGAASAGGAEGGVVPATPNAARWIFACLALCTGWAQAQEPAIAKQPIALVLHGGAGMISRQALDPEEEKAIRAGMSAALDAGYAVLENGGSAMDAVSAAIVKLEDDPHFNSGRGAVFNFDGRNELDASLMDGATLRAGAVAGLTQIRNPILLARAVMEKSPHVMLSGEGAERFAKAQGFELVPRSYFRVEARWQDYLRAKAKVQAVRIDTVPDHMGTVGAVALDRNGHLAAGTSTGGMLMKRWGRIGDSPIIGAGTWADTDCAVSSTGWGEFFIRLNIAHDICARKHYGGVSLAEAADAVIQHALPDLGGNGGVIALDASGKVTANFNTSSMFRAFVDADGHRAVLVFPDDLVPARTHAE